MAEEPFSGGVEADVSVKEGKAGAMEMAPKLRPRALVGYSRSGCGGMMSGSNEGEGSV